MDSRVRDSGIDVLYVDIDFNIKRETKGYANYFGTPILMASRHLLNFHILMGKVMYGYANNSIPMKSPLQPSSPNQPS